MLFHRTPAQLTTGFRAHLGYLATVGCRRCQYSSQSAETATSSASKKISIPARVERSPTDILKALSSTVKTDYTAPHHKFHDDPFLIPLSNLQKRTYALAKESGRKAAKYFLDNYPQLFYRDDAEPKIPAFSYKDKIEESTAITEEDLKNCINTSQVFNAIAVHKKCLEQNIELSTETTQALLELTCFYNSDEGPDPEYQEEQWYKRSDSSQGRKTWKELGFAEQLFSAMPNKDSKAYGAVIQGASKFRNPERAQSLYSKMLENSMKVSTETFNAMIRCVPYLRESSETRWELIKDYLYEMKRQGARPDVNTFNEILDVLRRGKGWVRSQVNALKIMREIRKLGLQPGLATYYLLLNIYTSERGPSTPILYEIMDEVWKQKTFAISHPFDVMFFVSAMDFCNNQISDVDLAHKIHNFLLMGDNYKLIGDGYSESVYYQNFFKLLATSETVENLMDVYDKYVPNIYTPEPGVMGQIINAIDLYEAYHYLPQIWTDMVTFEHYYREKVVSSLLSAMAKAKKSEELQQKFVVITLDLVARIDDILTVERNGIMWKPINWSGDMLSDCMTIFLNAGDLEKAGTILKKFDKNQEQIMGFMRTETLQNFCEAAMVALNFDRLNHCVRYAAEVGNSEVLKWCQSNLDKITDAKFKKNFEEKLNDLMAMTGISSEADETVSEKIKKETDG